MELLSIIFTFHFALICNSVILPVDANREQSELSFEELSNFAASNNNEIKKIISRHHPNQLFEEEVNGRIASGDPDLVFDQASPNEFPWMVSISSRLIQRYECTPNYGSIVALFGRVSNGVLINNQWILTSASGLYYDGNLTYTVKCPDVDYELTYTYPIANEAYVMLGALDMTNSSSSFPDEPQRTEIRSNLIIPHPDFNFAELGGKLPVDLALIQLPKPIILTEYWRPIRLPADVGNNMNELTLISYGSNSFNGSEIGMLRKANVTGQATSGECKSTFPNGQLNDSYVECVAGLGYAYKGDQGAAMAYWDGNPETNWTLTAIASWFNFKGRSSLPEVNATAFSVGVKIQPHLGWINSILNDDSITQPPYNPGTPLYSTTTPTPVTDGARSLTMPCFSIMTMMALAAFPIFS